MNGPRCGSIPGHAVGLVLLGGLAAASGALPQDDPQEDKNRDRVVTLDVSKEGAIRIEQQVLFRPGTSDDLFGLRKRLIERVGVTGDEAAPVEAELILRVDAGAPFWPVQGILDGWQTIERRAPWARVELVGGRAQPYELPTGSIWEGDGYVVDVIVEREKIEDESGPRSVLGYQIGEWVVRKAKGLAKAVKRVHFATETPSLRIVPRGELQLLDVLSLVDEVRGVGVEEIEIGGLSLSRSLRGRARARWGHIARGNWVTAYEFLTPARRDQESLGSFLQGKQDHEYTRPRVLGILDVRGETAFVQVTVVWIPHHSVLGGGWPDGELSEQLEMVETWQWVDGVWYWSAVERPGEFFGKHPELRGARRLAAKGGAGR